MNSIYFDLYPKTSNLSKTFKSYFHPNLWPLTEKNSERLIPKLSAKTDTKTETALVRFHFGNSNQNSLFSKFLPLADHKNSSVNSNYTAKKIATNYT